MTESKTEHKMSLGGHLDELRKRLGYSLVVLFVLFIIFWAGLGDQLKELFMAPHLSAVEAL
ncbi:hypothetical protein OAR23_00210, partial [bacterium]|nr:hypothetical protein [bacterium]